MNYKLIQKLKEAFTLEFPLNSDMEQEAYKFIQDCDYFEAVDFYNKRIPWDRVTVNDWGNEASSIGGYLPTAWQIYYIPSLILIGYNARVTHMGYEGYEEPYFDMPMPSIRLLTALSCRDCSDNETILAQLPLYFFFLTELQVKAILDLVVWLSTLRDINGKSPQEDDYQYMNITNCYLTVLALLEWHEFKKNRGSFVRIKP